MESKQCTKCGGAFPPTTAYFYRVRAGLRSWCKRCYISNTTAYKQQWPEQHRRHSREWVRLDRAVRRLLKEHSYV